MYDDWPGSFKDGKMQLYDVGMASMHTMDSQAITLTPVPVTPTLALALALALTQRALRR